MVVGKERTVYCTDTNFCGEISGTFIAQAINTALRDQATQESSLDPNSDPQQTAYRELLAGNKLRLGNYHAEMTTSGYGWMQRELLKIGITIIIPILK